MDDKQFRKLKIDIEDAMDKLRELQEKYHELTGGDYMPPLRLAPRKKEAL